MRFVLRECPCCHRLIRNQECFQCLNAIFTFIFKMSQSPKEPGKDKVSESVFLDTEVLRAGLNLQNDLHNFCVNLNISEGKQIRF